MQLAFGPQVNSLHLVEEKPAWPMELVTMTNAVGMKKSSKITLISGMSGSKQTNPVKQTELKRSYTGEPPQSGPTHQTQLG